MSRAPLPLQRIDVHVRVAREGATTIATDGDDATTACVRNALAGDLFEWPDDSVDVHLVDFTVMRR